MVQLPMGALLCLALITAPLTLHRSTTSLIAMATAAKRRCRAPVNKNVCGVAVVLALQWLGHYLLQERLVANRRADLLDCAGIDARN
jgi:hypothetical protein